MKTVANCEPRNDLLNNLSTQAVSEESRSHESKICQKPVKDEERGCWWQLGLEWDIIKMSQSHGREVGNQ
jgi:hypothetical protein